jgi:glycosyltransferase involved in cell wall biosynthesis
MDCSVVIPVYFNKGTLRASFEKVKKELNQHPSVSLYEVIFVDDGSGDGSYAALLDLKKEYPDLIRLLKFTRNFGQVAAIKAGYEFAKGSCVINISADLQDPPELIGQMLDEHYNNGLEIVVCTREDREESWFRKISSLFFYKAMQRLTFPPNANRWF